MENFNGEALPFNAAGRLKRAVNQLIGICGGIVADGEVNDKEIVYLSTWLKENDVVCAEFPGNQIARRINEVLLDGVISDDERADLLDILQRISSNSFHETGSASAECAAVPGDKDKPIEFSGKHFCFTGTFAFGKRKDCTAAVEDRGGIVDGDVTKALDYLVLGVGVSKDWKHETYGRKIEKAIQLRDANGGRPAIIEEVDFVRALSTG